jgi:hypothetical protein
VALGLLWVSLQLDTLGRRAVATVRSARALGDRAHDVPVIGDLQPALVKRDVP